MELIRINKYLPIALLYFFFNGLFLPLGLLYTTLLTPIFIIWLYKFSTFRYLLVFFLVSIPFAIIHLLHGVDIIAYIKSYLLLFTVFVFCVSFYQFLLQCNSLSGLFKSIVLINFLIVLISIILFFIPVLRDTVWYKSAITNNADAAYRLRLFTYEASYYSFLLAPFAVYYYLKILFLKPQGKWLIFWIITLPLILSLSFGVITALLLTFICLFCSDLKLLYINKKLPSYILFAILFFVTFLILIIYFFPDNLIFIRIENVFKGRDTSFSGRTFDSIYLGWKIAAQKSILFGAGPGQIKIVGVELFSKFYQSSFTSDQLAIPNNIGDILAQYGLLGVSLKLFLEIYFFFKTKVYNNIYRLSLFLFVFIYQFTGSFINNIAEYVIWIMAFSPFLFPQFNKSNLFNKDSDLKTLQTSLQN